MTEASGVDARCSERAWVIILVVHQPIRVVLPRPICTREPGPTWAAAKDLAAGGQATLMAHGLSRGIGLDGLILRAKEALDHRIRQISVVGG